MSDIRFPYPASIGDFSLDGRLILGPMAGVTYLPYREFMRPYGIALSVSEMISDCGIVYHNQRTFEYFASSPFDHPFALQLFGSQLDKTLAAIAILEKEAQYEILDLNFGCPVPKVTKTGAGSSWLSRPEELYSYVRAIVLASHKPVTAKIRLGIDDKHLNFKEVCSALIEAGVKMITIHARTKSQGYSGYARYELLKDLGHQISVPLCISGDINDPVKAKEAMQLTGASFLMLARYGVGDPLLAKELSYMLKGEEVKYSRTLEEQTGFALEYLEKMKAYFDPKIAFPLSKGILPKFFHFFPGGKKIRQEIVELTRNMDDMEILLKRIQKRKHL